MQFSSLAIIAKWSLGAWGRVEPGASGREYWGVERLSETSNGGRG